MSNRQFYEGIIKCFHLDVIKFLADKKGMPLYTDTALPFSIYFVIYNSVYCWKAQVNNKSREAFLKDIVALKTNFVMVPVCLELLLGVLPSIIIGSILPYQCVINQKYKIGNIH